MSLLQKASIITTPTAYAEDYLYSIKPAYALGSELVTNGTFATDSGWTKGSAWTISGGKAVYDDSAINSISQSLSFTSQKRYQIQFEVSDATGSGARIKFSNVADSVIYFDYAYYTNGLHTLFYKASANSSEINIKGHTFGSSFKLDNVSVKEVTDADFDFTRNSTGTRLNEDYLIEDVPYNFVSYSEDFTDSSWNKSDNATATLSNVSFPNGELTPFLVDLSDTSGTSSSGSRLFEYTTFKTGVQLTLSFYARSVSGTGTFPYAYYSSSVSTYKKYYAALTEEWKRYTFTFTSDFNNFPFGFTRRGDTHTETLTSAYITGVQIVKGDQPKDYLKTTDRLDIPRIDYTNGEPSILLEPQRQNLVTYSQDLSQWNLVNGTLTANATVSPEGIQNAGKVAFSSVGLDLKRTITVVAGTTYTISFYIKVEEGTGLQGRFYDNSNSANIEYYNYDDQIIPNQWSRITRSVTAPSGCTEMQIWLLASSTTLVTASWWGAQFEAGSYATSLIHTSGSAVTRSADSATNAGNSDLINSTEGVLYAEASYPDNSEASIISLTDKTNNQRVMLYWNTNNTLIFFIRVNSTYVAEVTLPANEINIKEFNKLAIKYKTDDMSFWLNGKNVGVDTSGTMFSANTLTTLAFNAGGAGSYFFGKTKCIAVFKEALTDLELEKLTGYNNHELYMNYYNRLSYLGLVEEYNVESDINNYIL